MPLTQMRLRLQPAAVVSEANVMSENLPPCRELSRSSFASSNTLSVVGDADTILVGGEMDISHLPTPSDSVTDASNEKCHTGDPKRVSRGRGTRVLPPATTVQDGQHCSLNGKDEAKSRSVSGETLVTSTRRSSLLQNGITALDLQWSMSSLFKDDNEASIPFNDDDTRSVDATVVDNNDDERQNRAATRRAKIQENARLREEKEKAADAKASRRSVRTSIIGRTGEAVSGLASSVFGKRPSSMFEKGKDTIVELKRRTSLRPRSMVESLRGTSASEGLVVKRRRVSAIDTLETAPDTPISPRKAPPVRKEKGWLKSGLYTGQTRDFDGRLTESKNKRKQDTKDYPATKENKVLPLPMFAGERLLKQGRDFKLPFDVFSPLPAGQPKPDEWRRTNKNIFIGEAAQFWRSSKLQEHSTCMCTPPKGCDSGCMNRFMFYECDEKNCDLTEEQCGNRSFEGLRQRAKKGGKYNVGVEVIKTADRGYGVRSNRTFEPNQIIVEYTGEIITQEECESRMRRVYKDNECYYLMLFDQNMIIDATRGSIARFINHSCEPNCRMEKWTVGGEPRMALFAGDKGIMTGDELTYDYNFDPFSLKNVQECRCGSTKCRGVLGPRAKDDKKTKADKQEAESKFAGAKRKIAQVLDDSTSQLNKKVKLTASTMTNVSPAKLSTKVALVKKPVFRSTSLSTGAAIRRRPSKLRRVIEGAKDRAMSKRVVSSSSASDALLPQSERPLSRRESVKAKAASVKRSIARTVKGA